MTKRHFEAIAKILGNAQHFGSYEVAKEGIIQFLAGENPRFDRERFVNAVDAAERRFQEEKENVE